MFEDDNSERIRQLEAENVRLRDLLDHRGAASGPRHPARNALGLMRAILRGSADGKADVADFVAHVEGRFDALIRVRTALSAQPDACVDLATLVSDEFLAQAIEEGPRASISGPTVRLEGGVAEFLGLVVHELATRAWDYGALTVSDGHIDVGWSMTADRRLTLVWAESGRREGEPPASFHGFDMEAIVGMLPYQVRADSKLEFRPEGLRCSLEIPVDAPRR